MQASGGTRRQAINVSEGGTISSSAQQFWKDGERKNGDQQGERDLIARGQGYASVSIFEKILGDEIGRKYEISKDWIVPNKN